MSVTRHTRTMTGVELHVRDVAGSDLVRDYHAGRDALAPFFAGFPADPDAFRRKAEAVHRRLPAAERARIAGALRATRPGAAEKLDRVLAGRGLAVTTGQQAGLFGGPLYTLYKVLTAVRAAESLEELLGQTVVPVFWVAADDHDWAEVNHTSVVDGTNTLRRIDLTGEDQPPLPMSERLLGPNVSEALETFLAALPQSEFAAPIAALVRRCYRPDASVASAFTELLLGVLSEFDVVIVDPAHGSLKAAAAPLLARELERSAEHAALLEAQSSRLIQAGYHAQVTIAADAANVLLNDESGRDRLTREDGSWMLRRTKRRLTAAEVTRLVAAEPWRFSANVLLRPVVESALIPTVAYVGGPAEIGYFAQIGCLFHAHGVEPPLVVPRRSVTVVEARVRKVLDKFGLEVTDLTRPFHEVATQVIRDELPAAVREPVARLRAEIEAGYDALGAGASAIDPTLEAWARSARNQALSQVDSAEKKITSHLKKRSEVELEQLRKAALSLYPEGAPQERVLNALPLLARYGPALLHDLAAALTVRLDAPKSRWTGVVCER